MGDDMAQINIPEMRTLVSKLEEGTDWLLEAHSSLSGWIYDYEIDHDLDQAVYDAYRWGQDQLPGVRRRLALAETLENSDPSWPQGTVEIDEGQISDVSPSRAENNGREAAEAFLESDGELDPELAAEIQQNMNDPYFAAGFASAASPEEISQAIWDVNNAHMHLGSADNPDGDSRATYQQLLAALGGTLSTATRNTGDLAMPDDYARQWVDVITSEPEDYPDERGGHSQALAVLLGHGTYSTPFLDHVSEELYDFERSFDGDAVWGPRAEDPMGTAIWDGNENAAADVMPYLMTALGNNAEAAQNFFDGGGTTEVDVNGETVAFSERLQYLIQERTWSDNDGSDEGAGLGAALEAATTTFRNRDGTGRISAEIASQTFALIGDKTGEGSGGWGPTADSGWQMYEGMRDNVATMMADYSPDLFRVALESRGDSLSGDLYREETPGFPDGMPYGALMDEELMSRIMGTLGTNQEHVDIVLSGAYVSQQLSVTHRLDEALAGNPQQAVLFLTDDSTNFLDNASSLNATGIGWIINNAYQGDKRDEELAQQRAEAWASIMSVASSAPFVPQVEGEWLQWGVEQAQAQALDAIENAPQADADALYGEMDAESQQALIDNTLNHLLQAGYLDESVYADANERDGGPHRSPFDPEFEGAVDPGPPPQFNFDSEGFQNWYGDWAPRSWLQNELIDPYNTQWPNIDP